MCARGAEVMPPHDGANDADRPQLTCRRCGERLVSGRGELYVVSIIAIADPSPLELTEDDLARNASREIQYLAAQMQNLSAQAAEDQVHRQLVFHLCGPCYQQWIRDPTAR
jgi:hypothetical protein